MPLNAGTRLGPYEILDRLGAGGMGEVYRARDTRLDRTVAIKICGGRFTERFEREARAISSLNHPHICALYDIGHEGGTDFLVMEHLDGDTLETRLHGGPLPIAEAQQVAIQIASALDAAHRQGVIHRDLKPANVMLTRTGAKLLDFGLARVTAAVGAPSGTASALPTAAPTLTTEGSILGTFQYMSPEQLEGKEADARSDIFAFGAVLFEMIAGRKAFQGASQASLITALMSSEPPLVSSVQPMASPALDRVIRNCLAKSPDNRWQSARDLLSELQWIAEAGSQAGIPAPVAAHRRRRELLPWLVAAAVSLLLLASLFFTVAHLREQPVKANVVRFQVSVPDKFSFRWYDVPSVSPNGEHIVFTASDDSGTNSRLFVRPLNSLTTTPLGAAEAGYFPFWSPDGRQIAFGNPRRLFRLDLSGGPPVAVCDTTNVITGGTWNRDGVIVFSVANVLQRVSASGGVPKPLGALAQGETSQRWPRFLPDGNHFLYLSTNNRPELAGIYVGSLDSPVRKRIIASDANAAYVPSGHLLYMRGNVLMVQPFDVKKLELRGEPRPLADRVALLSFFPGAAFSASPNGVLAWRNGTGESNSRLEWFDRNGKKLGNVGDPADFSNPALSPDEKKLAVCIRDSATNMRDIWVVDLQRGTRTRLTFDPGDDLNPVWSPDGNRIAFTSNRQGERDIYRKPSDGTGQDELLVESKDGQKNLEDWSPDGKYLLYNHQPRGQHHIYVMPLAGDRRPMPFLKSDLRTDQGQFSPNGRWISYSSTESGRDEIYVQGFNLDPARPRGKWQVSTAGGTESRWRRDGKELYYLAGSTIMAVDVKTDGPSFEAGIPKPLFDVRLTSTGRNRYLATKDGQRFLVNAPLEETTKAPIQVMVNWR
jgi:serine/threonine protein kinase